MLGMHLLQELKPCSNYVQESGLKLNFIFNKWYNVKNDPITIGELPIFIDDFIHRIHDVPAHGCTRFAKLLRRFDDAHDLEKDFNILSQQYASSFGGVFWSPSY